MLLTTWRLPWCMEAIEKVVLHAFIDTMDIFDVCLRVGNAADGQSIGDAFCRPSCSRTINRLLFTYFFSFWYCNTRFFICAAWDAFTCPKYGWILTTKKSELSIVDEANAAGLSQLPTRRPCDLALDLIPSIYCGQHPFSQNLVEQSFVFD
jgi:hypothetical protein